MIRAACCSAAVARRQADNELLLSASSLPPPCLLTLSSLQDAHPGRAEGWHSAASRIHPSIHLSPSATLWTDVGAWAPVAGEAPIRGGGEKKGVSRAFVCVCVCVWFSTQRRSSLLMKPARWTAPCSHTFFHGRFSCGESERKTIGGTTLTFHIKMFFWGGFLWSD